MKGHNGKWVLRMACPNRVRKGQTCKLSVQLTSTDGTAVKEAPGFSATVKLTILDADWGRDDQVLTQTYRFGPGETIKFGESFCANLKKDWGKTSEIYAKVEIRIKAADFALETITVKTPQVKVTTTK